MNSRQARRQAADKHNYERWLMLHTKGQRRELVLGGRIGRLRAAQLAAIVAMAAT